MPTPTIVLYHDIAEQPSSFEARLGVTSHPDRFLAQLEHFQKNYDIIDLDTLLNGPWPRRPLLITFDDCYRSVLDIAERWLAPRGIPGVLFTNVDLLGHDSVSLDGILSWFAERHGLPALLKALELENQGLDSVAAIISGPMAQRGAQERRALRDRLVELGGLDTDALAARSPILSPEDIARLPGLGVEIGNHTATHVHGRSMRPEDHHPEIVAARSRLEAICGHPVRAFSVPYGYEADLTVELLETLRQGGHAAIFLVHARSNRFRPAPDIWYRTSLHDEVPARLGMKLHALPLLRSLKKRFVR